MQKDTTYNYDQICERLLMAHTHPSEQSVEALRDSLARDLDLSPDRLVRLFRALKDEGRLTETLVINPLKTRFSHEIRLSLKFDLEKLSKSAPRGSKELPGEWFVQELSDRIKNNKELNHRLVIIEGSAIHGSRERDMELQIMTVDGMASIYLLMHTEILNKCDYVIGLYSETVSYSYRWRGLTGQQPALYPST